jgi:hypothetical protein
MNLWTIFYLLVAGIFFAVLARGGRPTTKSVLIAAGLATLWPIVLVCSFITGGKRYDGE